MTILVAIVAVVALLSVIVVALVRRAAAKRARPAMNAQTGQPMTIATTSVPAMWQAAIPSLSALKLHRVDAECYARDVHRETLFVKLNVGNATLRGWIERVHPGGVLEQFTGTLVELHPGDGARSPLAEVVLGAVREPLGALPREACLTVSAPAIPGDKYAATLTTPFTTPLDPAAVARVLLAVDDIARERAPKGAELHLSPVASMWQAALPSLEAMKLWKVDAECYARDVHSESLFVKLNAGNATLRGWIDRVCPGSVIEQFIGASVELHAGGGGGGSGARAELAEVMLGAVRELLGALPREARLTVTAPQIPGDKYAAALATPFRTPADPAAVARVLLAVDDVARTRAPKGAHPRLSPVAAMWQAAAPALEAMKLRKVDAEAYARDVHSETLFVKLNVGDTTLRGWIERVYPGGVLEQLLGASVELHPGEDARSPLAELALGGAVRELLGALPREACLTVRAPQIPGDKYAATLTTPFTAPADATAVARVLLAVDEAARRKAR